MTNVVHLNLVRPATAEDVVRTNAVLAGARKAKLTECIVLGYTPEGHLYGASTHGPGDTLWLLEQFKLWMLDGCPAPEAD